MNDNDIQKLIDGFTQFRAQHFGVDSNLYPRLTREGQSPRVMVIACCDSRVDPAIILSCDPGDLFIVRNVANLVPPQEDQGHYHGTSAALEFAVRILGIRHIIVLGHSRCGGIHTLLTGIEGQDDIGQFITPWMTIAAKARQEALASGHPHDSPEAQRIAEQASIRISLENLNSFAWLKQNIEAGTLHIHGWYFDLDHGDLLRIDPASHRFESLLR